jgi:hypothetical protein
MGGGLAAAERARRERVRLATAEMIEAGAKTGLDLSNPTNEDRQAWSASLVAESERSSGQAPPNGERSQAPYRSVDQGGGQPRSSLIHVGVPASITAYYRALSRPRDQHGQAWTGILNPDPKIGCSRRLAAMS